MSHFKSMDTGWLKSGRHFGKYTDATLFSFFKIVVPTIHSGKVLRRILALPLKRIPKFPLYFGSLKLLSFIFFQNLIRLLRRFQSIFSVSRPLFFLAIMLSLFSENFILNTMFSSWNLRIRKQNNYRGSPLFKRLPKFLSRNLLYVPGKSQLKSMNEAIFI